MSDCLTVARDLDKTEMTSQKYSNMVEKYVQGIGAETWMKGTD